MLSLHVKPYGREQVTGVVAMHFAKLKGFRFCIADSQAVGVYPRAGAEWMISRHLTLMKSRIQHSMQA